MIGHKNEPPIPAPVVVFVLAVPLLPTVQAPAAVTMAQANTLSVKNRCNPNNSKWAQPGSKAIFSTTSGTASAVNVVALPRKPPPAFEKLTRSPLTPPDTVGDPVAMVPPLATPPVPVKTCSAGASTETPAVSIGPN